MSTQLPAELAEQWEGGREWEMGECSWMPGPMRGKGSHFSTYGDPMDSDYSVPTILCREKWWRVLTTRVQENKGDKLDRITMGLYLDHNSPGAIPTKHSPERTAMKKIRKIKLRPKVSSHLNLGTAATSVTDTCTQPGDRKETKAADP